MVGCTLVTCALPDHINYRKPTLREYAKAEHAKLEQSSIELVEMKAMEEESKNPVPTNNAEPVGNESVSGLATDVVISVAPDTVTNHTEVLVDSEKSPETVPSNNV